MMKGGPWPHQLTCWGSRGGWAPRSHHPRTPWASWERDRRSSSVCGVPLICWLLANGDSQRLSLSRQLLLSRAPLLLEVGALLLYRSLGIHHPLMVLRLVLLTALILQRLLLALMLLRPLLRLLVALLLLRLLFRLLLALLRLRLLLRLLRLLLLLRRLSATNLLTWRRRSLRRLLLNRLVPLGVLPLPRSYSSLSRS